MSVDTLAAEARAIVPIKVAYLAILAYGWVTIAFGATFNAIATWLAHVSFVVEVLGVVCAFFTHVDARIGCVLLDFCDLFGNFFNFWRDVIRISVHSYSYRRDERKVANSATLIATREGCVT